MSFKLNISEKGKSWKVETESEFLVGKNVGDKAHGVEIKPELEGYELEITGGSDSAGFPLSKDVEGIGLRAVLLKNGWGNRDTREGVRLRKTVRGKVISSSVSQVNMNVIKHGSKKLADIFPEQNTGKKEEKNEAPKTE